MTHRTWLAMSTWIMLETWIIESQPLVLSLYFGGGHVSWKSIVAMSTIQAEYIAISEAAKEVLWLKGLITKLSINKVDYYCIVIIKVPYI